ncbi:MAG TPA: nitroreductase family protein [Devosia sp.]|nr:nitroreductase family protein [Devosia sp.]
MASGAALATIMGRSVAAQDAPGGVTVRQALQRRRSTRLYTPEPIAERTLLELLFAANGVNRPDSDGRTAPSWHGARDVDIYVAQANGVGRFDPAANALLPVADQDIRGQTSLEPFVGTAPVVLIYVSDQDRLNVAAASFEIGQPPDLVERQHEIAAYVDTAVVAENVYIYCAAEGLGTCLVGGSDPAAIGLALGLRPEQRVTYLQPVGHPAS